jgi:phage FluMu protein Com
MTNTDPDGRPRCYSCNKRMNKAELQASRRVVELEYDPEADALVQRFQCARCKRMSRERDAPSARGELVMRQRTKKH